MKTLRCLLFLCGVLIAGLTYAQTDSAFISHLATALAKQPPAEKVYLHLDKQSYNFADTVWYKAYVVIGQHHQLSALSGVLYVELVSPNDTLVSRQTLKLTAGVAVGDIPLAATLAQGTYRIRAYTRWMRNAGAEYFYNQTVRVGGIVTVTKPEQAAAQKPDIQFFPEGGELVSGLRSRVAVKAINGKGMGEDIKGLIEDSAGNVVADFATQHLGMGTFAIVPQSGKTYRAKISGPGEAVYMVDLPVAKEAGYTLAVNNSKADSIFIKVAVNEKLLKEKQGSTFYLLGQSAGKIYYTAESTLAQPVYMAGIAKSRFPSGIVQFTLFDEHSRPVAERIAFIQGKDSLWLQLTTGTKAFLPRQPIKFNLNTSGEGQRASGTFSVAVINETATGVDEASESTILNNLLLTSDLKGSIEQPNYYFGNSPKAKADLDVLMLTQGYRRFEWKRILNTEPVSNFLPERSLELSGTVQTMGGKPVPNGKIVLTAPRENFASDTVTDSDGSFKFVNLEMTDTAKVTLNAKKGNNKTNVKITVINPGYAEISKNTTADTVSLSVSAQMAAVLTKRYEDYRQTQKDELFRRGKVLKEVRIKASRPRQPVLTHSSSLAGPGHAEQVITSDQLKSCANLGSCLIGKIFGVTIGSDGVPRSKRKGAKDPVTIVVDGNIMDGSHINDFNVDDVYSIEVLSGNLARTLYGGDAGPGTLVITMKNGSEPKPMNTYFGGVTTVPFKGFTSQRTFYSPKYSPATPLPDMRNTVYWNPNIITGSDGNASFEYLNNDSKGTYCVVIEGIDDNGNLGRQVYRYKVE
nr:carboxypeptidase regulatory-like domain-containing protein [uncultured Mucilaginibacter sp.]